jgi:hypothetical protein
MGVVVVVDVSVVVVSVEEGSGAVVAVELDAVVVDVDEPAAGRQ